VTAPSFATAREAAPFGMVLAVRAREAPDRIALHSPQGTRSFAELNANANRLVRALRRRGLGKGDAVALVCGNRPEFVETYKAAIRAGLRVTPVNWHLTGTEMTYIAENCEARALIGEARWSEALQQVAHSRPSLQARLAIGGSVPGFESYADALSAESGDDLEDPVLGHQMLYTSGTTGHPKGVLRPPAAARGGTASVLGQFFTYRPGEDVHLCTGPLYHAAPLAFSLVGPLNAGVTVVLMESWDTESALAAIERYRVTASHMVPTMFHRMLALPRNVREKYDISSLRMILHGAAPCPVPVKKALIDWLGPIVIEYYAATEGFGSLVTSEVWMRKPGTVGKPSEGQVKILDETGKEKPAGEIGSVYLRAPEATRFEYFKDPDKTKRAFAGDGQYFTLGDMGYLDEEGYLFLSDRSADVIISGGVNIYPAEVDAVLLMHPAVADSATVGVPSDDWGEDVRAVVQLARPEQASPELAAELLAFCRERLAHYKCPRVVDFVEELPRHDTGKIYRRLVRERYWQGRERKI
jgi:long-chain acyl-CoA synthetase